MCACAWLRGHVAKCVMVLWFVSFDMIEVKETILKNDISLWISLSLNSPLYVHAHACTAPPTVCKNIELVQQRTRGNSITVRWERPEITGRDDFYYNIFYSEDNQTFTQHNRRPYVKQDALVDYSVSGLQPLTTYTIRVIPENGVSGQEEGGQSRSCEVVAMTGDTSECLEAMEIKYTDIVFPHYLNYSQCMA